MYIKNAKLFSLFFPAFASPLSGHCFLIKSLPPPQLSALSLSLSLSVEMPSQQSGDSCAIAVFNKSQALGDALRPRILTC